jgi:hypothetical protein
MPEARFLAGQQQFSTEENENYKNTHVNLQLLNCS